MKIFEWMAELRYRNNILYRTGLIHFVIGLLLFLALLLDSREVMGINTWIKPIKFCISIGIYTWTFGWILFDLPNSRRWIKGISWTIAITMVIEIFVIIYQASRATPSHFNDGTLLDGILFGTMGFMIAINTLCIILTFILYLIRKPNLEGVYLLGLRLSFVVFIIGNWVGGVMIQHNAHAVGVEDGGPGLPFTNWSTTGGDLRIAHFLGLHAIQLIPLFAWVLFRYTSMSVSARRILTVLFALAYAAMISFLYLQAMRGEPLIGS